VFAAALPGAAPRPPRCGAAGRPRPGVRVGRGAQARGRRS
jgi:hypothetical protein